MMPTKYNHPFKVGQIIEGRYEDDNIEHFIVTRIDLPLEMYGNTLERIELFRIRTQRFQHPTIERLLNSWMKDYGFKILEGI